MNAYKKIMESMAVFFFCLSLFVNAQADEPKMEEWVDVNILVNLVDSNDTSDLEDVIESANATLEEARIRLILKKVNKDVKTGNGDSNLTGNEGDEALAEGKKELEKTFGAGKGIKITVLEDVWGESPEVVGWNVHRNPVVFIEKGLPPLQTGQVLAHEIGHFLTLEHVDDANNMMFPTTPNGQRLGPNQVSEIFQEIKPRGTTYLREPEPLPTDSGTGSPGVTYTADGFGAVFDGLGDVLVTDPLTGTTEESNDPVLSFADLDELVIGIDSPLNPGGILRIKIRNGGIIPNEHVDFYADLSFYIYEEGKELEYPPDATATMHRSPEGIWDAEIYDRNFLAWPLEPPRVFENERFDTGPPEELININQAMELAIPIDSLNTALNGRFSLGGPPYLLVHGNTWAADYRNDIDTPTIVQDTTKFSYILLEGPPPGPQIHFTNNGITGHGFTPDSEVGIWLNNSMIDATQTIDDGTFLTTFPFLEDDHVNSGDNVFTSPFKPGINTVIAKELDDSGPHGAPHAIGFFETPEPLPVATILSITPENGTAPAGSEYVLGLWLQNDNRSPLQESDATVYFERPFNILEGDRVDLPSEFPLIPVGDGIFETNITSTLSGWQTLAVHDRLSGRISRFPIGFTPAEPDRLMILDRLGPKGSSGSLGTATFSLALTDQYNNLIPDSDFTGSTSFGNLTIKNNFNGTAIAELQSDGYGEAHLDFQATTGTSVFSTTDTATFLPIGLGNYAGYLMGVEPVSVPILLFLPAAAQELDGVEFTLQIPAQLPVMEVNIDPARFDGGVVEQTILDNSDLKLVLMGMPVVSQDSFDGAIGEIFLGGMSPGSHELLGGGSLYSSSPGYSESLLRGGAGVEGDENGVHVPFPRPLAAIEGKSEKRICADIFIAPGSDVSDDDVLSDVRQAEDIFYTNAQHCTCAHFLKIDTTLLTFNQTQWNRLTGGDGYLDQTNVISMYDTGIPVKPRAPCTKIFYLPTDTSMESSGASVRSEQTDAWPIGNYLKIHNYRDRDGRTLAHELAHHLSGNRIGDPDSRRTQRGAGTKDNLMSYDRFDEEGNLTEKMTGDNLTTEQCDLISWDHWRFDAWPLGQ
jgi:hypothetical protein